MARMRANGSEINRPRMCLVTGRWRQQGGSGAPAVTLCAVRAGVQRTCGCANIGEPVIRCHSSRIVNARKGQSLVQAAARSICLVGPGFWDRERDTAAIEYRGG